MGAGKISGYARAHEIGAIETRARHLRRKQARLDKAGTGQIDIKRPGLVQCRPIELGVRKVRVVEPRGAQVCAGQVEAGKIEPGKALAGEIRPATAGLRFDRSLHLGARHLGHRHVRRGEVEAAHGVLRFSGANRSDRERNREHVLHQSHGDDPTSGAWTLKGFVTPTLADVSFVGKMADGDLVRSPPIPA